MPTVQITVGGVDVTADVVFETAYFKGQVNSKPGEAKMRVRDTASTYDFLGTEGADWLLTVNGDAVWRGFVTIVKETFIFPAGNVIESGLQRWWDLEGSDQNILFERRVVFKESNPTVVEGTQFPPGTNDTTAITELLDNWLDLSDDDLDTTSGVEHVGDLDPAQPTEAWSGGWYWGAAMGAIAMLPAAIFYIRPEVGSPKGTLVYCDTDVPTSPFGLSDVRDNSGTPAVYQDNGPASAWQPNTFYSPGDVILGDSNYVWYCDTIDSGPQESGAVEPDWDLGAQPVSDGGGDILWGAVNAWLTGDWYIGWTIQPTVPNGHTYTIIVAGGDVGPEPTWPTDGGTVQATPDVVPFVGTYREMEIMLDGTSLANDVLAWGMGYGSQQPVFKREQASGSIATHGLWQSASVNTGIYKQSSISRVAESIINGSPENHRGAKDDRPSVKLVTYDPGLLNGHIVTFTSAVWGWTDDIPVRQMEVTFESPTAPRFELLLSHEIDAPWGFIDQFWPKIPGLPGFPGNPQLPGLPQQGDPCRECVTPEGPVLVESDFPHTDFFFPDSQWTAIQFDYDTYGSGETTYGPTAVPQDSNVVMNCGVSVGPNVAGDVLDNNGDPIITFPPGTWGWTRSRQYFEWASLPATTTSVRLYTQDHPMETTGTADVVTEYPTGFYTIDSSIVYSGSWVVDTVTFTGDPSYGTTGTGIASAGTEFPDEPSYSPQPWEGSNYTGNSTPLDVSLAHSGDDAFQIAVGPTTYGVGFMSSDDWGIFFPPAHVVGVAADYGDFTKIADYPTAGWFPSTLGPIGWGGGLNHIKLDVTYTTTEEVQEFTVGPYKPGTLELIQNGDPFTGDFYESDPVGGKFQVPVGVDTTGLTVCYTRGVGEPCLWDDLADLTGGEWLQVTDTASNHGYTGSGGGFILAGLHPVADTSDSDADLKYIRAVDTDPYVGTLQQAGTWSFGYGFALEGNGYSELPTDPRIGGTISVAISTVSSSISATLTSMAGTSSGGYPDTITLACSGTDPSEGTHDLTDPLTSGNLTISIADDGTTVVSVGSDFWTLHPAGMAPDPESLTLEAAARNWQINGVDYDPNGFTAYLTGIAFIPEAGPVPPWCAPDSEPCEETTPPDAPAAPSGFGCANAIRVNATTYTVPSRYQPNATLVWVDGLFQPVGSAYAEDSDHVTLNFSSSVDVDAVVRVCYYAEVSTQ